MCYQKRHDSWKLYWIDRIEGFIMTSEQWWLFFERPKQRLIFQVQNIEEKRKSEYIHCFVNYPRFSNDVQHFFLFSLLTLRWHKLLLISAHYRIDYSNTKQPGECSSSEKWSPAMDNPSAVHHHYYSYYCHIIYNIIYVIYMILSPLIICI